MENIKGVTISDGDRKCFACGRKLGQSPYLADTGEDQTVCVGSECAKRIILAGEQGWLPTGGYVGPRLYAMTSGRYEYFSSRRML